MAEPHFIPLAEWLAPRTQPLFAPPSEAPPADAAAANAAAPLLEVAAAIREARLFRAALADAVAGECERLVRDLAAGVLARELRIAPADIAALVAALLEEHATAGPVRVRVAPEDARIPCALPVVADDTLSTGDAVLEVAHGTIDARLGVRLADVLAGAA